MTTEMNGRAEPSDTEARFEVAKQTAEATIVRADNTARAATVIARRVPHASGNIIHDTIFAPLPEREQQ